MKSTVKTLCTTALVSLLGWQAALAQPSGLRLDSTSNGFVLRDSENGLRLRFSTQSTTDSSPFQSASEQFSRPGQRSSLSADLPLTDDGLHTSLGFSWDSNRLGTPGMAGSSTGSQTTPFFGLGWNSGASRSSRWALSAEVGTQFASASACRNSLLTCTTAPSLGLSGNAMGSGLHLTPYFSFGATYSFDR